jgi:hypothetical protein
MAEIEKKKNRPDHIRDGALTIAIWKNKSKEGYDYNTYTSQRSYKDEKGLWQTTDSYRKSDLLKLARLYEKAYDRSVTESTEVDENG